MKITLSRLINLKVSLSKQIQKLVGERKGLLSVQLLSDAMTNPEIKTVEFGRPERHFDTVTGELMPIRADYLEVLRVANVANAKALVKFEGEEYSIPEAIELAKQLRADAGDYAYFADTKTTVVNGYGASPTVTKCIVDVAAIRVSAAELLRRADALSQLIEEKNHSVTVVLDDRFAAYLG